MDDFHSGPQGHVAQSAASQGAPLLGSGKQVEAENVARPRFRAWDPLKAGSGGAPAPACGGPRPRAALLQQEQERGRLQLNQLREGRRGGKLASCILSLCLSLSITFFSLSDSPSLSHSLPFSLSDSPATASCSAAILAPHSLRCPVPLLHPGPDAARKRAAAQDGG